MPLVLACVLVAALEAPRAMHVFVEDIRGPYEGRAVTTASIVHPMNDDATAAMPFFACGGTAAVTHPPAVSPAVHSSSSKHAVDRSVARATR